ncbi:MAG: hypothetical protein JWQ98_1114 [Chlorobi bacterium]|nr:hypothetical protein [Chlorobiota bacterium]
MVENDTDTGYTSFLGTGWSFPPEFIRETGGVAMTSDAEDIEASLKILFGTTIGERFLRPKYGLDMHDLLFESLGTTARTLIMDMVSTAILIYEARIELLSLKLDTSGEYEGRIVMTLDYLVTATNSRYNLVYPFNITDGNEMRSPLGGSGGRGEHG